MIKSPISSILSSLSLIISAQGQDELFLSAIHYNPEPTKAGFACGTSQHSVVTAGVLTQFDIAYAPSDPLWDPAIVEIGLTGFNFSDLGVAANNLSTASYTVPGTSNTFSSYAPYFDWAFHPSDSSIILGTQNQVLPGSGSNPLAPDPDASGILYTNLEVPASIADGTSLGVQYRWIIPSYMTNDTPGNNIESSFTQSFCDLPEPSSGILAMSGGIILLAARQRKSVKARF